MSQNDFNIANQGFPSFRSDLNDALQALASNSSGATEPATTYAGQFWYDSTNDVLKFRNEANSAWIDPPIAGLVQALSDLGVTASAAELNKLDGVLTTTAELNYVDGVTSNIQTQLNGKVDTSGDSMTGNLSFGDDDKAIFGAGSDLQIYHDGGNSFISDTGTGNLILKGSTVVAIQGANGENGVIVAENGAVDLRYDNSTKLATTSSGIAVTGTVAATSYTGDGSGLTGVGGSTTYGDVGTYVVAYVSVQNTTVTGGQTFAGSALRGVTRSNSSTSYIAPFNELEVNTYTQSMGFSGTWRIMQHKSKSTFTNQYYAAALLVRIS